MASPIVPTTLDPHLKSRETVPLVEAAFSEAERILSPDAPEKEYQKNARNSSALHWGQRKLLISEIEFLTLHGDEANLVVYAGAAEGYHIPFLSAMFPRHEFYLYDPNPFAISETTKIRIFQERMTDEVADGIAAEDRPLLYISDIRTVGSPVTNAEMSKKELAKINNEYAARIFADNEMQLSWAQHLHGDSSLLKYAMVKFKLPYYDVEGKDYTRYPRGEIFLPVWGRRTTTEARLMFSDPNKLKKYNHGVYERQMAYFNGQTLMSHYPHDYAGQDNPFHPVGIDHCYSCRAELYILEEYVKKFYADLSGALVRQMVKNLSESMSVHLSPLKLTLATKINAERDIDDED